MALSDAVAAQVLGELHVLTQNIESQTLRVEQLATTVIDAAKHIDSRTVILRSQNEKFLVERVNEITRAVAELRNMEGEIQQAARAQANSAISPLVNDLKDVSNAHLRRHAESVKQLNAAHAVYTAIAGKSVIALVFVVMVTIGAFFAGMKIGISRIEKSEGQTVSRPLIDKKL
jgi:hypothetical protein